MILFKKFGYLLQMDNNDILFKFFDSLMMDLLINLSSLLAKIGNK